MLRSSDPKRKMKIAIFLDHNIIYRHFVKGGAFQELIGAHDLVFVVPKGKPAQARFTVALTEAEVGSKVEYIAVYSDRLLRWRRLFLVSQFVWRPGKLWRSVRVFYRASVNPKARILFSLLSAPFIYHSFRFFTLRYLQKQACPVGDFLDRFNPDVVIHPTVLEGLFLNDLVLRCRERGIPTVFIMNSWDNPSTKRAVVGQPDYLLVWGRQTQEHAVKFMGMPRENVLIFGAAQFEVYRQPPRVDRVGFCSVNNIDPNKTILLYAGSSEGTDEFSHLESIERAIDEAVISNVAVLYRPHPWGGGGLDGARWLNKRWKHIRIESSMQKYLSAAASGEKVYLADYADTHDVLCSVDGVVSPFSTIILEAMLHGKPCICFIPTMKQGSRPQNVSKLMHFGELFNNKYMLLSVDDHQLVPSISKLLKRIEPGVENLELSKSVQSIVEPYAESYAKRLKNLVEALRVARGES